MFSRSLIFLLTFSQIDAFVIEPKRVARDTKDEEAPKSKIKNLDVKSEIRSRFAVTKMSSEVQNLASEAQELFFVAQLPAEAFISNFTMDIDGRLEVGEVKGKEEAQKDYEKAKSQGRTTGLVAKKARETELFRTSVNVKAGGKVVFTLTYQEVLKRVHGVYKQVLNIVSMEGVENVSLSISIIEKGKFSRIHVPRFAPKIGEKTNKELLALPENRDVDVRNREEDGITFVDISFSPESGEGGQLAVLYDVERAADGGEIEVVNGWFVHFFAPESDSAACANNIVFVLDKSGSMRGRKFRQLQEAMATILRQLKEEDNFGIVWFSSGVQAWENALRPASKDNVDEALEFVQREGARGGTNIHAALLEGIKLLESVDGEGTKMVVFLTDGLATVGEIQDNEGIRAAVSASNDPAGVIFHCLSFGDDADFTLLRQVSSDNQGLARKIYQAADAALQLDGFYSEIGCPVFRDVDIIYLNGSVEVGTIVTNRKDSSFYAGSEQVTVGKLVDPEETELRGEISAKTASGAPMTFRCGTECFSCCRHICPSWCQPFPICPLPPKPKPPPPPPPADTLGGFIERMWAYMTIKKNLREAELDSTKAKQLRDEAKKLSLKYGFVTELTSLVIVDKETNPEPINDHQDEVDLDRALGAGFGGSPRRRGGSRRRGGPRSRGGPSGPPAFVGGAFPNLFPGPSGGGFAGPPTAPQIQAMFTMVPTSQSATTSKSTMAPTTQSPTTTMSTTSSPPCQLNLIIVQDNRNTSALTNSLQELYAALGKANIDYTISVVIIEADGSVHVSIDQVSLAGASSGNASSSDVGTIFTDHRVKGAIVLNGGEVLPEELLKQLLDLEKRGLPVLALIQSEDFSDPIKSAEMFKFTIGKFSDISLGNGDKAELLKNVPDRMPDWC